MAAITQQAPNALPGRRYGSFAGRAAESAGDPEIIFSAKPRDYIFSSERGANFDAPPRGHVYTQRDR